MRKNYLHYLMTLFLQRPFARTRGKSLPKAAPEAPSEDAPEDREHLPIHYREKRRHPRSAVGKMVAYSLLSGDGEVEERGLQAYAVDINEGGIGILTERPLEHGRAVRFEDEVVRATGIVRWRICFVQQNTFRIGIQFITKTPASR